MILFTLLTAAFANSFNATCDVFGNSFDYTVIFQDSQCPNTATGKISVISTSDINSTITYTLTNVESGGVVSSSTPIFSVIPGTYFLTIHHSVETRNETSNGTEILVNSTDCPPTANIAIRAQYDVVTITGSTVEHNPHCAGNYGSITCVPSATAKDLRLFLTGDLYGTTESADGVWSDLPVGDYRCRAQTDHCTSQSDVLEVRYEKECTDTQVWADQMIYGDGYPFFIAGIVLIAVGVVLNICVCFCCIKLVTCDRRKLNQQPKQK